MKLLHTLSISTHSYPDLPSSVESNQESDNWDLAGPNEEERSPPVIGLGFHCPIRPDSEHRNGKPIFKTLQVCSQVYNHYMHTSCKVLSWTTEIVEVPPRGDNGWYSDNTEMVLW